MAKLPENRDFPELMLFVARGVRFCVLRETHDNHKNNPTPPSHSLMATVWMLVMDTARDNLHWENGSESGKT